MLNKTEICQPALFLAGLAAVEIASQNHQLKWYSKVQA